jgi:seryl-tRNA(Sec) selenium transferase
MKRREIMKSLSVAPFAGGLMYQDELFGKSKESFPNSEEDIYRSLGIEPVINCRGTFTIIGGSIERPEVLKAQESAAGQFVQYDELAEGIGKRLAELTKTEWGIVTSGCAGAMKHVTAACVTGGNPEKLIRIPDLTGFDKTEVIVPSYSRNAYDHALRNVGVTIITVDTPEEMKQAIGPKTAMIYIMTPKESETGQPFSLEVIAEIAKPHGIPIQVDAAAEDLTIPPVHLERGATVVTYSGGKAICGPQCAGLALGDKKLLMSAWQASSPHHGPGRDNKVGKEEMLGMLAAVEAWTTRDHQQEWQTWLDRLEHISKKVTKIKGVETEVINPSGLNNRAPRLNIMWDPKVLNITGYQVAEDCARKAPRLAIGDGDDDTKAWVTVTPSQMQDGQEKIVADRLHKLLGEKRPALNEELQSADVSVSGHWDVEVQFFSSTSKHSFFIEQEGNWVHGTHKGEFGMWDMVGMVEGDQVKFRSRFRVPGDNVTFLFSGKASGDTMEGDIHLGEYLTAKFTAQKATYKKPRKPIQIPGGPPLAT